MAEIDGPVFADPLVAAAADVLAGYFADVDPASAEWDATMVALDDAFQAALRRDHLASLSKGPAEPGTVVDGPSYEWWIDDRGNPWVRHRCRPADGDEQDEAWRLPPPWRVDGGGITPSLDCRRCGAHQFIGPAERCDEPKPGRYVMELAQHARETLDADPHVTGVTWHLSLATLLQLAAMARPAAGLTPPSQRHIWGGACPVCYPASPSDPEPARCEAHGSLIAPGKTCPHCEHLRSVTVVAPPSDKGREAER